MTGKMLIGVLQGASRLTFMRATPLTKATPKSFGRDL